jgi:hypothetical protein
MRRDANRIAHAPASLRSAPQSPTRSRDFQALAGYFFGSCGDFFGSSGDFPPGMREMIVRAGQHPPSASELELPLGQNPPSPSGMPLTLGENPQSASAITPLTVRLPPPSVDMGAALPRKAAAAGVNPLSPSTMDPSSGAFHMTGRHMDRRPAPFAASGPEIVAPASDIAREAAT